MARAVALQAIGLGFKSPYLQRTSSLTTQGKGEEERAPSVARETEWRTRRERACGTEARRGGGDAGAEL